MGLSDHVTLTITKDSVGPSREGYGVPLILSATAAWAERIRFYTSLAGVIVDFPVTTSAEYLAAQALFSQNPKPEKIAIGRAALKPTQVYTLSIASVKNSYKYTIKVKGKGVTATTVEYTSDASATDGEIVAGLVAALNLVTGKNYTAAGATSPFTVTGTAAGDWFSLEVNPADITIEQTHADPGIATDLAAINLENKNWYTLITFYNSNAMVVAAAAWVEANKKTYLPCVNESKALIAVGASDTLEDLKTANYSRTMGLYHPSPASMFAAALAGARLPFDPGSETWKYAPVVGVEAVSLTDTQRANLRARNGNSVEDVAGVIVSFEGTSADGEFFDVIRGLDWLEDEMRKTVFETIANATAKVGKVPYTNKGVALIESAMKKVLKLAVTRQVLSDDPAPATSVPLVKDISSTDKGLRKLPDMKFTGTLAGAIHSVAITGVVSV